MQSYFVSRKKSREYEVVFNTVWFFSWAYFCTLQMDVIVWCKCNMIENTVKIFKKRSHGVCGLRGIGRFNIGIGISTDVCRVSFFLDEEVGGGPWKFLCGNPKYRFLGRLCSVGKGRESGPLYWNITRSEGVM